MSSSSWNYNLTFCLTNINMWIDMDQSQYGNSRVIIVQKSVSLSLAMEWILARSYFNIVDLSISWMPAIRISLSVCRTSIVSTTFIKNINYFVWWIIWHFVRTDILLNLSKLTNDAFYNLYFLLSTTTLTLLKLTKSFNYWQQICTNWFFKV